MIEPERDVFFSPAPAPDESNAEEAREVEEMALYPLSFKTFGNYGVTWSPCELTDEQLAEQVAVMNERMAVYDKAAESVTLMDLREQLSAVLQEKRRRLRVK